MSKLVLLVVAMLVAVLSGCFQEPESEPESYDDADWTITVSEDPMEGRIQAFATSGAVSALRGVGGADVSLTASLGIGCDSDSRWAYLTFSRTVNSVGNETDSYGNTLIPGRVRWDDLEPSLFRGKKQLGGDSIQFPNVFIHRIKLHDEARFEIEWYGKGRRIFKFDLNGADEAINKAAAICGL